MQDIKEISKSLTPHDSLLAPSSKVLDILIVTVFFECLIFSKVNNVKFESSETLPHTLFWPY